MTAADFVHTADLHADSSAGSLDSTHAAVSDMDPLGEKTVRVVFDRPYGGWKSLFERVFQAGDPAGSIEDIATTGPFVFDEWAEGEFLAIERAQDWWATEDPLSGGGLGEVQRVTFLFMDTNEEMVSALDDGEVDVVTMRPDGPLMAELSGIEGIEIAVAPGPFWEHIDFHHDDPILSQPWAREAITLAIDREKILDRTVRLVDADAAPIDNTVWMSQTSHYEPHYDDSFDPDRARRILGDNGCSPGDDGILECSGDRMSFVWASTNDDPGRHEIFESAREDLEAVGIEIVGEFRSPSAFVTRDFLFGGPDQWQLVNFSWRAQPDPIAANPIYYCDERGTLNVNRYCSEAVERLVRSTEELASPDVRAAVYNRADRLYLEDHALIPLYQKPTLMAWTAAIDGPEPNYTISGDLWNLASWTGAEELVVALPSEPAELDPLSMEDDSANVILGTSMYGAFGMDPAHERAPVLVESVEMITGEGG